MAEMKSYNMVNTAGFYAIGDGGRLNSFDSSIKGEDGKWRPTTKDDYQNDRGATREVVYKERPEQNWERQERGMTDRARNYYPNPRESALERELLNQVSSNKLSAPIAVNPRLEAEFIAWQSKQVIEGIACDQINKQLFDQISAR